MEASQEKVLGACRAEPGPGRQSKGRDGNAMTTGDPGENVPSSGTDSQDGGQPQDVLLGQPQGFEPELDAYGVPVQDRSAKGLVYLGLIACPICAAVSALLAIVSRKYSVGSVPAGLAWLGAAAGILAAVPANMILRQAEKKKQHLGPASRGTLRAATVVGYLGFIFMMAVIGGPSAGS